MTAAAPFKVGDTVRNIDMPDDPIWNHEVIETREFRGEQRIRIMNTRGISRWAYARHYWLVAS